MFCIYFFCVYIICDSYIVNLVVIDFKKNFEEVSEFVKCFRNMFFVFSGRKSCFFNFFKTFFELGDNIIMLFNFIIKSWGVWFDLVIYYVDWYLLFKDFVVEEIDYGRSIVSSFFFFLEEMYKD